MYQSEPAALWLRPPPEFCPNRHPLTGPDKNIVVGFWHCDCAGTLGHQRLECMADGCGQVYLDWPHGRDESGQPLA